jgi:hypothetical protein
MSGRQYTQNTLKTVRTVTSDSGSARNVQAHERRTEREDEGAVLGDDEHERHGHGEPWRYTALATSAT